MSAGTTMRCPFKTGGVCMRKWGFLGLMFGLSLLNGGFFVRDTLRLMGEGIAGVDNQASLLFIPIFWIIAAAVLLVIYAWALIYGIRIERRYRFRAAQLVCLSELSRRELVGRGAFFAVTGLLMWAALELSVEYALSGGGLLACLYLWKRSGAAKGSGGAEEKENAR